MAGNDLGSLLGGLLGGGSSSSSGNILSSLLGALGGSSNGGNPLSSLMGTLNKSGLEAEPQSWVAIGENKAVNGEQMAQALPDQVMQKVAQENGVSSQKAADVIADSLPLAVDKLTPEGKLPPASMSLEELIKRQTG